MGSSLFPAVLKGFGANKGFKEVSHFDVYPWVILYIYIRNETYSLVIDSPWSEGFKVTIEIN